MVISASEMDDKGTRDRELGVRLCGRLKVPLSLKLNASTPFQQNHFTLSLSPLCSLFKKRIFTKQ